MFSNKVWFRKTLMLRMETDKEKFIVLSIPNDFTSIPLAKLNLRNLLIHKLKSFRGSHFVDESRIT